MDPEELKKLLVDEPLTRPDLTLHKPSTPEEYADSVNTDPKSKVYNINKEADTYLDERNLLTRLTDIIYGNDSRTVLEGETVISQEPKQPNLFIDASLGHQLTKFFESEPGTGGKPNLGTYSDANQPATGWGHRMVGSDSLGVSMHGPTFIPKRYGKYREAQDHKSDTWFRDITPEEAETLFQGDYSEALVTAEELLEPGKFNLLPVNAQAAFVDMIFNMGKYEIKHKFGRMITALNEGNVDLAAQNILYINADRPNEKNYLTPSDYYSEGGDRPKYIMDLMTGEIELNDAITDYKKGLSRYNK